MVAYVCGQAHDQFLPDGVDGRVGHLGEQLLEIIEQERRLSGEDGQRRVISHGAEGLRAFQHHGTDNQLHILLGKSELALAAHEVRHFRRSGNGIKQRTDGNLVFLHPAAVRHAPGHFILGFSIGYQPVVHQVAVNHLPGTEAAFAGYFFRGNVRHARFRSQNENIIRGQRIARGAQAVAVQHGASIDAIGKNDGGRTVPGLHHGGVVFKETAHIRPQMVIDAPGLRHEHKHDMAQVPSGGGQQLNHVVQAGGIALAGGNKRQQLLQVIPQQSGRQMRLTHAQVIQVPAQGIDFPVVGQIPEGMGQAPGWERIRAVALVDKSQGGFEMLAGQISVKSFNLRAEEQPLVHNAAAGAAAHITAFHAPFHFPAHHEQFAFKFRLIRKTAAVNEQLTDQGARALGVFTDAVPIHGNLPPRNHAAAVFRDGGFQFLFMAASAEHHGHPVFASGGKLVGKRQAEKFIRKGQQNARAVPGIRIAPHGAAVHEPLKNSNPRFNDFVARFIFQVSHQANAAGVPLLFKIIQSLRRGNACLKLIAIHQFAVLFGLS